MIPAMAPLLLRRCRFLPVLAAILAGACACSAPPAELTVFAAASLQESFDEAAAAYQEQSGTRLQVAYGASSALARQIEQGAPAQVFVSADQEWMDYLQQRGRIAPGSRHDLLGNRLVLVAPASSAAPLDLARPGGLAQALGQGRLAIGQTDSVPAGRYARAALEKLGHWEQVQGRLAEAESVRAALMLVARGEVPLGIVYASDARAEPRVRVVADFPAGSHPPIIYPLAAIAPAGNQAQALLDWLQGSQARAIFQRHGFILLVD